MLTFNNSFHVNFYAISAYTKKCSKIKLASHMHVVEHLYERFYVRQTILFKVCDLLNDCMMLQQTAFMIYYAAVWKVDKTVDKHNLPFISPSILTAKTNEHKHPHTKNTRNN